MAFMDAPSRGTLYAKFEPMIFGEMAIKEETVVGKDWYYQNLLPWPVSATDTGSFFDAIESVQAGEACPPLDYDSTSATAASMRASYSPCSRSATSRT